MTGVDTKKPSPVVHKKNIKSNRATGLILMEFDK